MEYIKVSWIHDFDDEPILLFSELDEDRNEIRKVEVYKDDSFGFSDTNFEFGEAKLGSEPVPKIDEINSEPQFLAQRISKEEFERVWSVYVNFLNKNMQR